MLKLRCKLYKHIVYDPEREIIICQAGEKCPKVTHRAVLKRTCFEDTFRIEREIDRDIKEIFNHVGSGANRVREIRREGVPSRRAKEKARKAEERKARQ